MDTRPNNLDIQFEQLPEPTNGFRGFSIEALNLLIEQEQNRRLRHAENPFNCYVYELRRSAENAAFDSTDLQNAIIDFAERVNVEIEPARLQLIIKNSGHYTGLDIQIARRGNECLILDAASDLRMFVILNRLKELKKANGKPLFKRIYCPTYETPETRMQVDIISCPIFSFDHVCQSSKLDIFKELDSLKISPKNVRDLTWMNMPPELVWNAQSMSLLDAYREHNLTKYFEENSARGLAFDKYLTEGQKLLLLPTTVGYKFQNHSIQRLFESYRDIYLAYRRVSLPSRSPLGEERLSRKNLDFDSMSLPAKLQRIIHANININGNQGLIEEMRAAITLEDFKQLAARPVKEGRDGIFKKSDNLYSLRALCKAIIKDDEDKINKIYRSLFREDNIPKSLSKAEASPSNLNK